MSCFSPPTRARPAETVHTTRTRVRFERHAGTLERMRSIALHRLGRVPYACAQALQRELVQLRRRGEVRDTS